MTYKYTIPQNTINWRPEQHFQRIDKYSLYLWDEKRIETWEEVVTRSVNVLRYLSKDFYADSEYQRIFDLIYNLEISPSMRLLSMPLKAIQRCNTVLYNCTAGICDTPKIFSEAQYLSMSGCGVAWSVEKIHINKLPTVPTINLNTNFTHNIEDSQIGWAISTNLLIETLYTGNNINFDYSLIRPNGSPLKTKGGYASGPQPLIDYHNFIRDTFVKAQGRKLTSLEVHDLMCYALESGISGATRRSAGLCLFDKDDELMTTCKYSGFWNHPTDRVRANANNSIVMNGELSKEDIETLTYPWFNGLAEPGIFKRDNAINSSPKRREFLHPEATGINPCVIVGTMVHTKNGDFPIEALIGKEVDIWNGQDWQTINNFRITGENQPVYTVTLQDGTEITATEYHKFILADGTRKELKDLTIGDKLMISDAPLTHGEKKINAAYLKGFMVGDGTLNSDGKPLLYLYEPKYVCEDRLLNSANELEIGEQNTNVVTDLSFSELTKQKTSSRKNMRGLSVRYETVTPYLYRENGLPKEIFEADYQSKLDFIAGLFDADGTAIDNSGGWKYQYSSIHIKLLQDIQLLLKSIDVKSKLSLMRAAGVKDFNDGYGEYKTKDCYRLTLDQQSSLNLSKQVIFERLISFSSKEMKNPRLIAWNKIVNIKYSHIAEYVYCCTVEGNNTFSLASGVLTANCGEIILQPIPVDSEIIPDGGWQFCNLSTVNVRPYDTNETLLEKTKYVTIIGDIQSLATNFQFIRQGTKTICDKDRLLGVNLSNYALSPIIRSDEVMEQLRLYVNQVDEQFSKDFNVPISAAQTASKPSGNSSVLCYMGPGSNLVHSKYQKRNMTINKNSAMHNFLLAQGVERHDYPGRDYASLFTFLIDYPDTALTLESSTAIEQLEIWKQYKLYWCEHNPSCSITYKPHEVELIKDWLYENQNIIAGLAFFPEFHAYELAPIVPITENEFKELIKLFPTINWDNYSMYETGHDDRQLTVDCASGECVIHY